MGDLQRFITAQDGQRGDGTLYELALKEIQDGKLGLDGREEAKAYFEHPILRERLIKAAQILLEIDKPIFEIFSNLGVMKLRTCMLLFASISDEPVFKQVLRKYGWK